MNASQLQNQPQNQNQNQHFDITYTLVVGKTNKTNQLVFSSISFENQNFRKTKWMTT
jgi:hypothetical protein